MIGHCFVLQFSMFFLVLQLSHWGREREFIALLYSGWVVTWFCLDTLYGCSNTLFGYSDRMYLDFSMFSHLYPESFSPFSSHYFFPIKRYHDNFFKLLSLSINSVTKKTIVVIKVYFYNTGSIFSTKKLVTESVLKVRSFMRISWHL